jgi:flagellar hook assembly protein FlgD
MVRELVKSDLPAGTHKVVWDGTDDDGRDVGSGVYFYRMTIGDFTATKKMLLIK